MKPLIKDLMKYCNLKLQLRRDVQPAANHDRLWPSEHCRTHLLSECGIITVSYSDLNSLSACLSGLKTLKPVARRIRSTTWHLVHIRVQSIKQRCHHQRGKSWFCNVNWSTQWRECWNISLITISFCYPFWHPCLKNKINEWFLLLLWTISFSH